MRKPDNRARISCNTWGVSWDSSSIPWTTAIFWIFAEDTQSVALCIRQIVVYRHVISLLCKNILKLYTRRIIIINVNICYNCCCSSIIICRDKFELDTKVVNLVAKVCCSQPRQRPCITRTRNTWCCSRKRCRAPWISTIKWKFTSDAKDIAFSIIKLVVDWNICSLFSCNIRCRYRRWIIVVNRKCIGISISR